MASAAFRMLGTDYQATPAEVGLKSVLDGLLTADWRLALLAQDFVWHADVGAFSTPITGGGAGTVIDLDQPEFVISVPSGKTLIPLRIDIACMPGLQTTDSHESEILLAADIAAAYDGTGTVTTETPFSLRTSTTTGCPATVVSACTADLTDPTLGYELGHAAQFTDVQGVAATVNMYQLTLKYEPLLPPWIVGPAAIYGYWGGSIAMTGFAQLDFAVINTALHSSLQ